MSIGFRHGAIAFHYHDQENDVYDTQLTLEAYSIGTLALYLKVQTMRDILAKITWLPP